MVSISDTVEAISGHDKLLFMTQRGSPSSLWGEDITVPAEPSGFDPKGPNSPRISLLLCLNQFEKSSSLQIPCVRMMTLQTYTGTSVPACLPHF